MRSQKLFLVEQLAARKVGRNTEALAAAVAGDLARAGTDLAACGAPRVVIISGSYIPFVATPGAETDGPLGVAHLAAGLAASGCYVRVLTDALCAPVVRAALAARRITERVALDVLAMGRDARGLRAAERMRQRYEAARISHLIAVERLGPSRQGRCHNMRGRDVSQWTGPVDAVYRPGPWRRIAICDGGNELGMGRVSDLVAAHVAHGERIACVEDCDELIVAGTSNWAAVALLCAWALSSHAPAEPLLRWLTAEGDRAVAEAMVVEGLAVDGVTGRGEISTDGLSWEEHWAQCEQMIAVARSGQAPLGRQPFLMNCPSI